MGIEDFGAVGMEMFKVKITVVGTPIRDLVMRLQKTLICMEQKVGVGQLKLLMEVF